MGDLGLHEADLNIKEARVYLDTAILARGEDALKNMLVMGVSDIKSCVDYYDDDNFTRKTAEAISVSEFNEFDTESSQARVHDILEMDTAFQGLRNYLRQSSIDCAKNLSATFEPVYNQYCEFVNNVLKDTCIATHKLRTALTKFIKVDFWSDFAKRHPRILPTGY